MSCRYHVVTWQFLQIFAVFGFSTVFNISIKTQFAKLPRFLPISNLLVGLAKFSLCFFTATPLPPGLKWGGVFLTNVLLTYQSYKIQPTVGVGGHVNDFRTVSFGVATWFSACSLSAIVLAMFSSKPSYVPIGVAAGGLPLVAYFLYRMNHAKSAPLDRSGIFREAQLKMIEDTASAEALAVRFSCVEKFRMNVVKVIGEACEIQERNASGGEQEVIDVEEVETSLLMLIKVSQFRAGISAILEGEVMEALCR